MPQVLHGYKFDTDNAPATSEIAPDRRLSQPKRATGVPKISEHAWHGPIGEAVVRLSPTTEADPVAVLATTLALFGGMMGDGPHVMVGGTQHPARVWPLIIGKTGSGRKGTSMAAARHIASVCGTYADSYLAHRLVSGLASGEGLIAALGEDDDGSEALAGRLTIVESEFARVLTAAKREGSTLGPVLRQLWDDGSAATLTKKAVTVNGAHPIVIAHVTPRELRIRLAESDLVGGTINRFLPILSERPHLLAHEPARPDLADLGKIIGDRLDRRGQREIKRDRAADLLWSAAYTALNEDEPDGPLGSVLARGPAYVMRLALVYALADGAATIGTEHLLAALALWHYATETARVLFADTVTRSKSDVLAEYIKASGEAGRTRTEITTGCFKGNVERLEIDAMLAELIKHGNVKETEIKPERGRPITRYHWSGPVGPTRTALAALLDSRTNEVTKKAA